ncbi:MAG: acetamidase/formamidase family protein, partial [Chloroflexi bacterium]|nr:acetamidase/formamidase family protein [Chloroflexota bacterium]
MKSIEIDRGKRLRDEPHKGHNRWHPDIPPVLEVEPGEEVVLETRDASDGQTRPGTTVADLAQMSTKVGHPLTGPVYVRGAQPGDLLEIEYLDISPQPYGFTRFVPGRGFLREVFTEPYLVHWDIADGWATSAQLPGVRIPDGSFMGTAGLAPSRTQLQEWTLREAELFTGGRQVARAIVPFLTRLGLPIVYDARHVAAGTPTLAVENIEGYTPLPDMFGPTEGLFLLRV